MPRRAARRHRGRRRRPAARDPPGPRPRPPTGAGPGPAPSNPPYGPPPGSARWPARGHPARRRRPAPRPERRCRPTARTPGPPARPTAAHPAPPPAAPPARPGRRARDRPGSPAEPAGPRPATPGTRHRRAHRSAPSPPVPPLCHAGCGTGTRTSPGSTIGPMQILDHHQQPGRHRGGLQRVEHLLEQPELGRRPKRIGTRRVPSRRCAARPGHETGQPRRDPTRAVPFTDGELLNNRAEDLRERSERQRRAADDRAVPRQRAGPPIAGRGGHLGDETGLAGAGLATDQHRDRLARPRLPEELVEQTKLHRPPHEAGTGEWQTPEPSPASEQPASGRRPRPAPTPPRGARYPATPADPGTANRTSSGSCSATRPAVTPDSNVSPPSARARSRAARFTAGPYQSPS